MSKEKVEEEPMTEEVTWTIRATIIGANDDEITSVTEEIEAELENATEDIDVDNVEDYRVRRN